MARSPGITRVPGNQMVSVSMFYRRHTGSASQVPRNHRGACRLSSGGEGPLESHGDGVQGHPKPTESMTNGLLNHITIARLISEWRIVMWWYVRTYVRTYHT